MKLKSVTSYWEEGEFGKGPRTESWGAQVKSKTSAVMALNSKYVGRKFRESEGCAGFHNFRSHNKTSKQAKTVANVGNEMKHRLYRNIAQSDKTICPFDPEKRKKANTKNYVQDNKDL